jgi:hypothetical protein
MVRAATPDHAAPALDIKLNQNPNAFFFPASTISGHVIYKNHYGNADYDLRLIFVGTNKISVNNGDTTVPEKATLFEYTFNLHTARKGRNHKLANSQVDTAPMTFPFKHRFPSATDNRSFQVSLSAGSTLNTAFSNHVHDLPPSFGAHSCDFQCSVEYSLRAELHYDKCLLSHHTLPVMFLPYMRPAHGTRQSPTYFINPSGTFEKPMSAARKDSLIGYLPDSTLSVDVELPSEITVGHPFTFEVQVQVPFRPTFDDEVPVVKVLTLKMLSTTQCRTVSGTSSHGKGKPEQQYHKSKSISLHPSSATSAPTLDTSTNTIYYSFQATLSSYYPPSFRSFLVSSTFTFGGTLLLSVDGEKVELMVATNEVAVLSPVTQQPGTRRTSVMTANNRFGAY